MFQATKSQDYDTPELVQKILEIYSENPLFQAVSVAGSHHVHLNSPHLVAPHITNFVDKHFNTDEK